MVKFNRMKNKVVTSTTKTLTKANEFQAFIKMIKNDRVETWTMVAEALGVSKNTITAWKKIPEAQKAISDGIQHALNKMEKSGKHDWRMWREKLSLLGIKEKTETTGVRVSKDDMKIEFIHHES